jgi:hypothetical protein
VLPRGIMFFAGGRRVGSLGCWSSRTFTLKLRGTLATHTARWGGEVACEERVDLFDVVVTQAAQVIL